MLLGAILNHLTSVEKCRRVSKHVSKSGSQEASFSKEIYLRLWVCMGCDSDCWCHQANSQGVAQQKWRDRPDMHNSERWFKTFVCNEYSLIYYNNTQTHDITNL